MNAVDTNVLPYSIDRNEPAKQLKAQRLLNDLQAQPTVLLWQVFNLNFGVNAPASAKIAPVLKAAA